MGSAQEWIQQLALEPHVEGGFFRRTFASDHKMSTPLGAREAMTSIYYLLSSESPVGYFHRNNSDILHYFHSGSSLTYHLLFPDGRYERHVLGVDLATGQRPQLIVPGGTWKATVLEQGDYGLLSEAVAPGFHYEDMQLAREADVRALAGAHWEPLKGLVKSQ